MPHGEHLLRQTAFRLPEELRAWLREQAAREDRTMTAIVTEAIEDYRKKKRQPVLGYLIDGKPYHPADVTVVRRRR